MHDPARWPTLPLVLLAGCAPGLTVEQAERLAMMELRVADQPRSPTNHVADDPAAAELGRRLFFDPALSQDGRVACASCHDPAEGLSDAHPVSLGAFRREGGRHSMPIATVSFQRFLFWDGRADSAWAQPLQAIEGEVEMDFTRVEVARFVAEQHRAAYEELFGPLPELDALPARARPGLAEWETMSAAEQDQVNRVFANVGKALEAYERRLSCVDTRFDRWARGELELTPEEEVGAARFVGGGCIECHGGPNFSDGKFHNIGIGSAQGEPDRGRAAGVPKLLADLFNGAGPYSDDPVAGQAVLDTLAEETGTEGAFRTPSLRGVGQRRFFGHRGHVEALDAFLDDVYDDPHLEANAVGELDPKMDDLSLDDTGALVAFLATLDCPPLPPELGAP